MQVEVDRLAAAPRKTLNRNPAGKIACSQSSQGGQTDLAYSSSTCSRPNWRYSKSESQEVGGRFRLFCCLRMVGPDRSMHAKLQATNLGASSETFDYQTRRLMDGPPRKGASGRKCQDSKE